MGETTFRAARTAGRGLALLLALLLGSAGVVQAVHGTAASHARSAAARCDGTHAEPAVHGGSRDAGRHDEARCTVCQGFAQARALEPAPLLHPQLPAGLSRLVSGTTNVASAGPCSRAHPPRAPPSLRLLSA